MIAENYLSIVIAANNADYGGQFIPRLQRCIDDKVDFVSKFGLPTELILVEWNSPLDRPPLSQALHFNANILPTKIYTVTKKIHDRYYNPGGFSFLEYMAKNVGIRRAKGQFVLSTNADIIFSYEMASRLASRTLSQNGKFYRANRYDWDKNGQVFQINYAHGTFPPWEQSEGKSKTGVPYRVNMPHFNASGDFMLMSKMNWMNLRGYPENTGYMITLDGEMVHIALTNGLEQEIFPEPIYHQFHEHNPVKPWYMPPDGWSDATPRGTKNALDDWGLAGETLTVFKAA